MLTFAYPWLLLLLVLPLLARWLLPAYREPRRPVRVPFMSVLTRLAGQEAVAGGVVYKRIRPQWIMLSLVWIALPSKGRIANTRIKGIVSFSIKF